MQRFVARQNIQHFKHLLEGEQDEARRQALLRMIAEEERKLAGAETSPEAGEATAGKDVQS